VKLIEKFKRDRKASALALVTMMVVLVTITIVGLVVVGQLQTTAEAMNLGTSGNATRTVLFTNTYAGFNLAVIIPIVAAAGAILGVVFAYLGREG
jgi:competence protein ComGC